MLDEMVKYGGDSGEEDEEMVSFSLSASDRGKVVVARLNFWDG